MGVIRTIGILGAGQMGGGIAQVAATAGIRVNLADMDEATASAGKDAVVRRVSGAVSNGRLQAEDADELLSRIQPVGSLEDLREDEMIIEAVSERLDLKGGLLRKLHDICNPQTIFASNTSSISITELAGVSGRPDRVIGMHFFNPVTAMQLVEVIRGLGTSESTYEATMALTAQLGKTSVTVNDKPGFVVNRLLVPMLNEACFLLDEGVASREDIDKAMQLGCNHPMGPLALADLIGLDTCLSIMEVLHDDLGEDKYRPASLLRKYVKAGWLGRKSGRGFYSYD